MYNYALLLKDNGHYSESAAQLEQLVARYPAESRAHLALANLCAQQLHDNARARTHYAKVLETDPHNTQAGDIRQWIAEHR
jgi:Tfp pilus assembly protein PilF